jgi:hypothetical protein
MCVCTPVHVERETLLDISALGIKPKPAELYHLARQCTARALRSAQLGKPALLRSCSTPNGASLRITLCRADGDGRIDSTRILAQALMETSENP